MLPVTAIPCNAGWRAELYLGLAARAGRTVMARRVQRGPLAVQRPFYPEKDVCHLYLLHPPGGVVGGDQLRIEVDAASGSAGLLTTPGATKFYRSNRRWAHQQQIIRVAAGASLEWLPQENIFFPGGYSRLTTEIHLAEDARFIGWEVQCLGRPANQERFETGQAGFHLQLSRDGKPLLIERLSVDQDGSLDHVSGLRGCPVLATLVATGIDTEMLELLERRVKGIDGAEVGFTLLGDVLVCRYLGHSTEQARKLFVTVWGEVRPRSIGRPACPPRIWST